MKSKKIIMDILRWVVFLTVFVLSITCLAEYKENIPLIIHGHRTTWHDGGVAILLPSGKIVSLAAERVGDRYKHSFNSKLAYDHLINIYHPIIKNASEVDDLFLDYTHGLELDNHHKYHAAAAFYGSDFSRAAILVIDGQGPDFGGKRASTTLWVGDRVAGTISPVEQYFLAEGKFAPQSIGHFYTAIGAMVGMQRLYEEGKTMGLASYGKPSKFLQFLRKYAYSNPDGSFFIDPDFIYAVFGNTFGPKYFNWDPQPPKIQAIWDEYVKLRQFPMREPNGKISEDDMNVAYAGQVVLEEIVIGLAKRAKELTGRTNLCLTGGVALNSVVNGRLSQLKLFDKIFVFPAAGDDGQAMGKLFLDIHSKNIPVSTKLTNAYFGPEYGDEYTKNAIENAAEQFRGKIKVEKFNTTKKLIDRVVELLASQEVIGWYKGRSELGPRALGHRSIFADPRKKNMRDYVNKYVKHREWYRPLAPIVLEEHAQEFFDLNGVTSPYMLIVAKVKENKRHLIPAVTHVDGTARVQTINKKQDPTCYALIEAFGELTGVPVLLNTSFNDNNEPIVETPQDAINSFMKMNFNFLVLDNYLIQKLSITTFTRQDDDVDEL